MSDCRLAAFQAGHLESPPEEELAPRPGASCPPRGILSSKGSLLSKDGIELSQATSAAPLDCKGTAEPGHCKAEAGGLHV